MAAENLEAAADVALRHPTRAAELDVDQEEIASWRDAARAVVVPYDEELGVTAQGDGFTHLRPWDFEATNSDEYPLLLHFPYYLLYSSQVVKHPDLVLALYTCGQHFDARQKARDFDYYERITVRDSSLSACIQATIAAEVGHVDLAYDYFAESAFIDLRDLAFNTSNGVHLASLAGTWLAAVAGFGGMRDHDDTLSFSPRQPSRLSRLAFRLSFRGRCIRVQITRRDVRFELLAGDALEIRCHGEPLTVSASSPITCELPPARPLMSAPDHPPRRMPPRRHREA
jgi:alpha,alpha-trehalose phosphorylase